MATHHRLPLRPACSAAAFVVVLFFLVCTCSVAADAETVIDDFDENRIVNGVRAKAGQYPFFVQGNGCGAVLVAPDVVLTAAHCVNNFGNGRVLVGAVRKSAENVGNAQWRNILGQKYVHPNYVTKNENNDLMIFKIEPVTKPNLRPIALNGMQNRPRAGQQLKIIGFGAVDNGNTFLPELRQATVKYMKNSVCNRRWIGYQIHQKTHLCAANFRARSDICSGDSGGPIFTTTNPPVLVGIVSFSHECAHDFFPAVYSRVSGNIEWIKGMICALSDSNPTSCGSKRTIQSLQTPKRPAPKRKKQGRQKQNPKGQGRRRPTPKRPTRPKRKRSGRKRQGKRRKGKKRSVL